MGINGTCKRILADNCRGNNADSGIEQTPSGRRNPEGQGEKFI